MQLDLSCPKEHCANTIAVSPYSAEVKLSLVILTLK